MKQIKVYNHITLGNTSYEILTEFECLLISGFIQKEDIVMATINKGSDFITGIGCVQANSCPVRFFTLNGYCVELFLTHGYKGSGPDATYRALRLAGFSFAEEDITEGCSSINLVYAKDTYYNFVDAWTGEALISIS